MIEILGTIYLISVILLAIIGYVGAHYSKEAQDTLSKLYEEYGKLYFNITLITVILTYPVSFAIYKLKQIEEKQNIQ